MNMMASLLAVLLVACTGDDKGGEDDTGTVPDDTGIISGDSGGGDSGGGDDTSEPTGPTIQDVQQGVIAEGDTVSLDGVIVTSPQSYYGFFIGEPGGGAHSGVWVYTGDLGKGDKLVVAMGDELSITGVVAEYGVEDETGVVPGTLTQLILASAADASITGSVALPMSSIVTTSDLADPKVAELYEGVVVTIEGVTVTNADLGFGEWQVDDGVIIDNVFMDVEAPLGGFYDAISGPLYYSYGAFKIEPRSAADLVWGCAADACVDDLSIGDLVISELMPNPDVCYDADCEWFEILNNTAGSVNLQGLGIGDLGTQTTAVVSTVVIPAGGHAVLAVGDGSSWGYSSVTPSGWYSGGAVSMTNTGDSLRIFNSSGDLDSTHTYLADDVDAGVSIQLSSSASDATSNDDGANWCQGTDPIGDSGDMGTPGSPNKECG